MVLAIPSGIAADMAIDKQWSTRDRVRKLMEFFGTVIPAVSIITMGYLTDPWEACVTVMIIGFGSLAFTYSGHQSVIVSIAPNYAATAYGIMGTFSASSGFLTPVVVNAFTAEDPSNPQGWVYVFAVAGSLLFFAMLCFVCFARFKPQKFNYVEQRQEERRKAEKEDSEESEEEVLEETTEDEEEAEKPEEEKRLFRFRVKEPDQVQRS